MLLAGGLFEILHRVKKLAPAPRVSLLSEIRALGGYVNSSKYCYHRRRCCCCHSGPIDVVVLTIGLTKQTKSAEFVSY